MNPTENLIESKLHEPTKNLIEANLYMNPSKHQIELKHYMSSTKTLIEANLYMNPTQTQSYLNWIDLLQNQILEEVERG